jgi:hypothetical protein
MNLYLSHEPVKPYPCPMCNEYLASDAPKCRHCGAEIDSVYAQDAARRERLANRSYRKGHYSKHLWRGGGIFILGMAVMIGSYFLFPAILQMDLVWIPRGLIAGGGADFLYGLWGHASEARSAKREIV